MSHAAVEKKGMSILSNGGVRDEADLLGIEASEEPREYGSIAIPACRGVSPCTD